MEITAGDHGSRKGLSFKGDFLLGHLSVPFYTVDVDGKLQWYNRAAAQLWSTTPKIGETLSYPLISESGDPLLDEQLPATVTIRSGKPLTGGRYLLCRSDGSKRELIVYTNPLTDAAGSIVGAAILLVDFTNLETAGFQDTPVRTHPSFQPLASAVSPSPQIPWGTHKERPVENEVWSFESVDSEDFEVREISLDLYEVLAEMLKPLRHLAQSKNIELTCSVATDVPRFVVTDVGCLRQILTYLIGNSIRFTEHGEIQMRVSVGDGQPVDCDRFVLQFSTCDAVIGKPFKGQAGISQQESSDLGLAVIERLVERLGGKIAFDNEPGGGRMFHVEIPAQSAASWERRVARTSHELYDPDIGRLPRPIRVLLVEDNVVNQRLTEHLLTMMGHSVEVAGHGIEALHTLEREEFDLVLMDIHMPVMDGMEATIAIRKSEHSTGKHQAIVALTAGAMDRDRKQCLEAGFDEYIAKPIDVDELFATVTKVLVALDVLEDPAQSKQLSVDRSIVLSRVNGNRDLLREVVRLFRENSAELIDKTREALQRKDPVALRFAAHALKGAAANFGPNSVQEAALRLEMIGRFGDLDGAESAFDQLIEALNELNGDLAMLITELAQSA